MRRVFVDPGAPQRDALEEAATWILRGGVVALPTDAQYRVAVDPFRREAVARLFDATGRALECSVAVMAANADQIESSMGSLSTAASRLAERFWPGLLTLLVNAPAAFARGVGSRGTVGVRVPAHDIARAILAAVGAPVAAARVGADPSAVEDALGDRIDLLIDTGRAPDAARSTVVDVTGAEPRLVRAGAVSWDEVQECLRA